jgi:hypothetical protein
MLEPYTLPSSDEAARHTGHRGYLLKHAGPLSQAFGQALETVAVVRDPLERMQSWYRYRMRPKVKGLPASTHGIRFEAFMQAYLDGSNPDMASVGRQDRFVGWTGQEPRVDHVFDYAQLGLLETFFSERIGDALELPLRNKSPEVYRIDYTLSDALLTRYASENAEEFALYDLVRAKGHVKRAGLR